MVGQKNCKLLHFYRPNTQYYILDGVICHEFVYSFMFSCLTMFRLYCWFRICHPDSSVGIFATHSKQQMCINMYDRDLPKKTFTPKRVIPW